MSHTYQAMQAQTPGAPLQVVRQPAVAPGAGQVRVIVEAAGVCHTDADFLAGYMPGVQFPLITGH